MRLRRQGQTHCKPGLQLFSFAYRISEYKKTEGEDKQTIRKV